MVSGLESFLAAELRQLVLFLRRLISLPSQASWRGRGGGGKNLRARD